MKVTLIQDYGTKLKGTSFEISSPVGQSLITKGVAVVFGTETPKKEKKVKEPKTEE